MKMSQILKLSKTSPDLVVVFSANTRADVFRYFFRRLRDSKGQGHELVGDNKGVLRITSPRKPMQSTHGVGEEVTQMRHKLREKYNIQGTKAPPSHSKNGRHFQHSSVDSCAKASESEKTNFFGFDEEVTEAKSTGLCEPYSPVKHVPERDPGQTGAQKKYGYLFRRKHNRKDMEKVIQLPFGYVRLDGGVADDLKQPVSVSAMNDVKLRPAMPSANTQPVYALHEYESNPEPHPSIVHKVQTDFSNASDFHEYKYGYDGNPSEYFVGDHGAHEHSQNKDLVTKDEQGSRTISTITETESELNFFDEHYFPAPSELTHNSQVDEFKSDLAHSVHSESYKCDEIQKDMNFFDFPKASKVAYETVQKKTTVSHIVSQKSEKPVLSAEDSDKMPANVFDEQYFSGTVDSNKEVEWEIRKEKLETSAKFEIEGAPLQEKTMNSKTQTSHITCNSRQNTDSFQVSTDLYADKYHDGRENQDDQISHSSDELPEGNNVYIEKFTKQELRGKVMMKANVENPKTAYDMAMKMRLEAKGRLKPQAVTTANGKKKLETLVPSFSKWDGKVDSHGFRILTNQTLNLDFQAQEVVVRILRDCILFETDEIIAINKPYGMPSHGGPGVHHSIGQLLEPLTSLLNARSKMPAIDHLYLVHRLDKETTGVMLLAKSLPAMNKTTNMFVKREVIKKYMVITKGVPNPGEGVIDIPIAQATVGDRTRMALRPQYPQEMKILHNTIHGKYKDCREAVTRYRVLSEANSTALVECQPETGVKHQIRCHLAFGLNTPILGDHKYSHYSKIAPQRLYPETLTRLQIRQAKVRHLPMHLHAFQLVLPEFTGGRNLFVSAKLPRHFVQNMNWLKLKSPKN